MLLEQYNTAELMKKFCEDWRSLINRRVAADGEERQQLDKIYNKLLPYVIEIEKARSQKDLSLLGLVATAGCIMQEYFSNG